METDALLWLAQELLDLSMIESGQQILRLVRTPLKQVVEDASERLESQAEMKSLTIVSQIPRAIRSAMRCGPAAARARQPDS